MQIIDAPEVSPAPYGILSVASPPLLDVKAGYGFTYETVCAHGTGFGEPECGFAWNKSDTAQREWVESTQFVSYSMETCGAIGREGSLASQVALLDESWAIETNFAALVSTEVAPATSDPVRAVALLEQWFSTNTSARPILHMQRAMTTLIGRRIQRHGNHLEDEAGTLVSAGTGYESAPWPGTARIWISGPVSIMRGRSIERDVLNATQNEVTSLWETPYALGVACSLGHIDVTVA